MNGLLLIVEEFYNSSLKQKGVNKNHVNQRWLSLMKLDQNKVKNLENTLLNKERVEKRG